MAQVHTHHEQLIEAKAIIETLFASGHLTPEQVFTPAILQAMGWIQTLDPAAAAIIKSRFKRAKISLRDLDKSLKSYQPRLLRVVEEGETPPLRTARDCLSDVPLPTLVIPDPFSLQDDATVRLIEDEMTGQHDAQAIAFAPILITGRLENIDDPGQWLRLEWKRGTKWHRYDADRGQALNAQKLLDLASQGFPVASENVAHVAQYLHHLEAANYHTIPAARMATRLGWQGPLGAHGFLCGRHPRSR